MCLCVVTSGDGKVTASFFIHGMEGFSRFEHWRKVYAKIYFEECEILPRPHGMECFCR
eukprot:c26016_g1_i1 orf=65-238(+)